MRKYIAMALAATLSMGSMGLVACGGNNAGTTDGTTTEATTEAAADPAAKFAKEWKFAYIQAEGITIAGDLTAMEGITGQNMTLGLTLAADNTGTFTLGDETYGLKWELKDDDSVDITVEQDTTDEATGETELESSTATAVYRDDELVLEFTSSDTSEEESASLENIAKTGEMVFTEDGTTTKVEIPSIEDATAVTSDDQIVGDWNLKGLEMGGMILMGEGEAVQSMFGESSGTLTISADGTCALFGADSTWTKTDDGYAIVAEAAGLNVPIKLIGDDLALDLGASVGEAMGISELFMIYGK